uniref:Protein artemis n=1 Tax=Sphaeramia orbicularis TaxID=375764 RepID=A0A673ALR1_9TELE
MSSFAGRMKEYPTVSLDRFDRENVHARAYFLSHCHKDHMKGLKGPLLKRKLHFSRTVRLYCSFVTKELLLSNPKYAFWEDYIVSPLHYCHICKEDVVVTLLPAGHCPGSVMFLFEGSQGNVLYTGDFRLAIGDASRIEHLHSGSRVKDIQSVYLDSTFYDPRFYKIPTREVCLNGISELVGNWISQSSYHVVWLNCKAAYGYEYLFTNLGEQFNTQIHVKSLAMFKKMPEILSYVTTDRKTQIHACRHPKDEEFFQGNRLPCGCTAPDGTPLRIISIKPSTMWFGERSKKTNVIIKTGASSFRACFSFHSSYSEIKDFLSYLKPANVYPSVIPIGQTLTEVTQMLKLMCRNQSDQAAFIYKPLGVLKRTRLILKYNLMFLIMFSKQILFFFFLWNIVKSPQKTALPDPAEESLQPTVTESQTVSHNYLDCTESNDEEEGEEEEEEEEEEGQGDMNVKNEVIMEAVEKSENKCPSSNPPKWQDFFTTEMLSDSQNSQSQSCCSAQSTSPSRMTGSQTPELFSDEEESTDINENFSLTLSASLSNHSSQNQDSSLPDTLILHPEQRGQEKEDMKEENDQPEMEKELSESQVSSDFDVPCTPESQMPRPDELAQLYRKLASGEDAVIRKESQGSV